MQPRNYLRVRGEYAFQTILTIRVQELPPRARRIRVVAVVYPGVFGTTSACAENTPNHATNHGGDRNYLRVRGEYAVWGPNRTGLGELPPRARRIPVARFSRFKPIGTTSACAENTAYQACYQPPNGTTSACAENTRCVHYGPAYEWNYLRVRGEYARGPA